VCGLVLLSFPVNLIKAEVKVVFFFNRKLSLKDKLPNFLEGIYMNLCVISMMMGDG